MFPFIQSKNKEGAVTKVMEHSVAHVAVDDGRDLNPTPKGFRCSSTCIPRATKAKVPAARQESGGTSCSTTELPPRCRGRRESNPRPGAYKAVVPPAFAVPAVKHRRRCRCRLKRCGDKGSGTSASSRQAGNAGLEPDPEGTTNVVPPAFTAKNEFLALPGWPHCQPGGPWRLPCRLTTPCPGCAGPSCCRLRPQRRTARSGRTPHR